MDRLIKSTQSATGSTKGYQKLDTEDQHERDRDILFSADDDDELTPRPEGSGTSLGPYAVIAPPLRSTIESREAEFDLDPDELEDHEVLNGPGVEGGQTNGQSMPLLVGLLDRSARRSLDFPLRGVNEPNDGAFDLEHLASLRKAGGGMLDSIANMANSILGAGIIGLPYALRQAGFVMGVILLVVLCCVTDWTIRLIVINAKLSGRNSYIDIMDHCFGRPGRAAVSAFQFAFAFGGMCAFGIIIGDTIPQFIRFLFPNLSTIPILSIFANRQFIVALCTVTVSYPLSLYRDIHKLARASGFALVGMAIIVISVLIEAPKVSDDLKGNSSSRFTIVQPRIFEAIGVISFAFVCHHNSLLIYGSLRTPTLDRFTKVTHVSTAISLVACLIMAISAYVVFTDKTQGNILNNFSKDNTLINVARFCFGLNMFTTLPLELFVCREVIEEFFFSHEQFNYHRHVLFTTAILFSSMFLSMITCDLGVMLEITGGVSATALAFIFPAICYIRLSDPRAHWTSRSKLPAVVCATFGFTVMVLSLVIALGKAWTPEGTTKICT